MKAAIRLAVLMPHAPVLVPALAGPRLDLVERTISSMRKLAQRIVSHHPGALVLISPHSPRRRHAFGVWTPECHQGSLARFDSPELAIELPNDSRMITELMSAGDECGADLWLIDNEELDHGAVVPLWFLQEAGWHGPTTIVGLNQAANGGLERLGKAIARAASRCGRTVAVIASGDMSHRLRPGAPCGHHPDARCFDDGFIQLIAAGDARGLMHFDRGLRGLAGEDVVDSTAVALAAVGQDMRGHQVLSYEGPFGVGYGVAVLHDSSGDVPDAMLADAAALPRVARLAVASALGRSDAECPAPTAGATAPQAPVFVTLRTADGGLRGCVGTIDPQRANVIEETWFNARAAAFEDARFPPLQSHELDDVIFEVSVLHSFEEVDDAAQIDPQIHGVIVSASSRRRGLLLPAIKGVETSNQQLAVARRKGHIKDDEPIRIQRFRIDKFVETHPIAP